MLQDIYPHIFSNEFKKQTPAKDDFVFIFSEQNILIGISDTTSKEAPFVDFCLPTVSMLPSEIDSESLLYLFSIDDRGYFLCFNMNDIPAFLGFSYEHRTIVRKATAPTLAFACMNAWHLNTWYRENIFCGKCGHKRKPSETERALVCPACHHIIYPKIMPAVIVAVTHGDRLLVSRYKNRKQTNWALLAGFIEFGESGEDTVRREVFEETGLRVKNIKYFASQPWGIDLDFLVGYSCEVDGDSRIHLDKNELSVAKWLQRDEIPKQENLVSLTATMIEHFRTGSFE